MVVLKYVGKSLVKVFLYYFLPELLRDCVPVSRHPWKQWLLSLCFVCSLLWHKSFIIYENYYIQWLLPLILWIFSASLTGSDDFVLFDSSYGNVLCDIPILCKLSEVNFVTLNGNPAYEVGCQPCVFGYWCIIRRCRSKVEYWKIYRCFQIIDHWK